MKLATRAIALCICAAALGLVIRDNGAIAFAAVASTQQRESEKGLNAIIQPRSESTEPVDFSIGGVRFRVPRNYIIRMENWNGGPQTGVSLRVDTLNFRPRGKDNAACFALLLKNQPPNCSELHIGIMSPRVVASAEGYKNSLARLPNPNAPPKQGPFSYEVYDVKGLRFYRKQLPDGYTIVFECLFLRPDMTAPCYTYDRLAHGEIVMFGFWSDKIGDAERLEQNIRRLVDSFVVGGGGG